MADPRPTPLEGGSSSRASDAGSPRTDERPVGKGRRPSFHIVLLLAILPQIALAVGLVGWLSYRSSQRSIEDVAVLLRDENTHRIQEQLTNFFAIAPIVGRLNQEYVNIGLADPWDLNALAQQFRKQLQVFDSLSWVAFGREDGDHIGLQQLTEGVLEIDTIQDGDLMTHELLPDGSIGEFMRVHEDFDPRARPWYRQAVEAGEMAWSPVYQWVGLDMLCLDAVVPVVDASGQLQGVIDAGFSLDGISDYLATLRIGSTGRPFIIERSGLLIAAPNNGVLAEQPDGTMGRVLATESSDPLVRQAAAELASQYPDLGAIDGEVGLELVLDDSRVFIEAAPLNPSIGLDWLIVVAVPDTDFMAHADANIRTTLIACFVTMLVALLISLLIVRWISGPLVELTHRARRVQKGDLNVSFEARSRDEIGVLAQTMNDMVHGLKERELIRNAFGRYVDEELAKEVMASPEALAPGGTLQQVTILMSDLRGFSVLSARYEPTEMVRLLNQYLSRMTDVIMTHGGMINEFIGDAILVLFGAPHVKSDDAERALRCAIGMQMALDDFNEETHDHGELNLKMGIGIHTGDVIVGNIGSEQRVKYGVVGDAVNMAGRIESLTVGGQILVSRNTLELASNRFDVGEPTTVKVKGRAESLTVFELLGVRRDPTQQLRAVAEMPLRDVNLDADLYLMRGKSVVDQAIPIQVTRMGERGLELTGAPQPLERLQNVQVRLRGGGERPSDQLPSGQLPSGQLPSGWYAKVQSVVAGENGASSQRYLVTFTSEAEPTLEDRLRDQITRTIAHRFDRNVRSVGVSSSSNRTPEAQSGFLSLLAATPIETSGDRLFASRILLEIACADGVVNEAERHFVGQFLDSELGTIEEILSYEPLSSRELEHATDGPIRDTMLALAWATALCDAELAVEEEVRLSELRQGLAISESRALELRGLAQLYLSDVAFSIVWPEGAELDAAPQQRLEWTARDIKKPFEQYTDLIEGWAPQYGELLRAAVHSLPSQLEPDRILEIGCGNGNLSHYLFERFPVAELHLVDRSADMLARCQRRLSAANLVVHEAELSNLEFDAGSFDLIVTSLTFHHLDNAAQREMFGRIHGWLRSGGCFSYSDVFFGPSPELRDQQLDDWRGLSFALGLDEARWAEDAQKNPASVACSGLDARIESLAAAGFAVVDCPFKRSVWTALVATK